MSSVLWGRVLMADTLAFHILFALFGVGIPLLISLAELVGLWKKDHDYIAIAQRASFTMVVLFVVGAISGTIVAVEFFMLWPGFVAFAGPAIGLPMFSETFSFFIEAIFLGIYVYTWDRWKGKWRHWWCSVPIVLASCASAFLITTVNAFMNVPSGIVARVINGSLKIVSVDPLRAMFGPAVLTETTHSIFAYYAATAFVFAAMYAWALVRRRKKVGAEQSIRYFSKALTFSLVIALGFSLLVGFTGDRSARFLVSREPVKLAAMEQLPTTIANAPLNFFGLKIPGALSLLAGGNTQTVVKGLADVDPKLRPPSFIHPLFDLMATSGIILVLVPAIYFVFRKWRRRKAMAGLIGLAALAALFSVEAGWIVTEVGRQPFVVAGFLPTFAAFTTSSGVVTIALIFPVLYLLLATVSFWILAKHYLRNAFY